MTLAVTYLKTHSRIVGGLIFVLLLGLVTIALPAVNGTGGTLMAQTTEAISRFIGRSPGDRGETDLIKTKNKRAKGKPGGNLLSKAPRAEAGEPEERALGKIFDTPPEEAIQSLTGVPIGPLALGEIPPGSFGDLATGGGGPNGSPGFPGGGSVIVPPGTSVGPGNPPTPTEPTTPTIPTNPVGAVPEPGTWALMLLGFGLCGAAMRRRRPSRLGTSGAA